jgi:hypothetical protein
VAAAAIGLVVLVGLYVWRQEWIFLPLAGFALLSVVADALTWRRASLALRRGDFAPVTPPGGSTLARREDPELGAIEMRAGEDGWCLDALIDRVQVVVTLAGDDAGPSPAARATWLSVRDRIVELWATATATVVTWWAEQGRKVDASEVAPERIDVTPDALFDGGDVVFWLQVASDDDGTYYVPTRDGKSLLVHRDS